MAKKLIFSGNFPAPDDEVERVHFRERMAPVFAVAAEMIGEAAGHSVEIAVETKSPRGPRKPKGPPVVAPRRWAPVADPKMSASESAREAADMLRRAQAEAGK